MKSFQHFLKINVWQCFHIFTLIINVALDAIGLFLKVLNIRIQNRSYDK